MSSSPRPNLSVKPSISKKRSPPRRCPPSGWSSSQLPPNLPNPTRSNNSNSSNSRNNQYSTASSSSGASTHSRFSTFSPSDHEAESRFPSTTNTTTSSGRAVRPPTHRINDLYDPSWADVRQQRHRAPESLSQTHAYTDQKIRNIKDSRSTSARESEFQREIGLMGELQEGWEDELYQPHIEKYRVALGGGGGGGDGRKGKGKRV